MSRSRRAVARLFGLAPKSIVWRFARHYIAGSTLDDAIAVIRELNSEGCRATLDVLGEDVSTEQEVAGYVREYVAAIDAIAHYGLDANLSVKPTAMGLKFAPSMAVDAVGEILAAGRRHGMFVRLDMEDSSVTQATLDLYRELKSSGADNVGVVLQSYLRRTLADARELAEEGAAVRICKGIYIEPREVAYQDFWLIRDAFVDALDVLLAAKQTRVAIATHDEWLVFQGRRLIRAHDVPPDRYEFQMLLGVDPALRRQIVADGHGMRVYVPYGQGWLPYSTRRLVENPRLAGHVARNVLGLGPGRERPRGRVSGGS